MSVRIQNWVWDHSQSTGNDRMVLLFIADQADDDGTNAYPGIARIAAKARLPQRTVMRCLERLEAMGELEVIRPDKPGRGKFNVYRVVTGPSDTLSPTETPRIGATTPRKGDTQPPLTSDDGEYSVPKTQDPRDISEAFARFYEAYPLHKEPVAAKRAFTKALKQVGGDAGRLIEAAKRYRDDPNRDPSFTKYPASWLNAGCWDDDPLPPKPKLNGHKPEPTPHVSVPFAQRKADEERARAERQRLLERLVVE